MELLTIITIVSLSSSCIVTAISESDEMLNEEGDGSSIVNIEIREPVYRQKRSQRDFMILIMTSQNFKIDIPLRRVKRKVPEPVLFVMTLKGLVADHLQETEIRREFFRSQDKDAAFSVEYRHGNLLEIHGHFILNGSLHSVLPANGVGTMSKQTSSMNSHKGDRTEDKINKMTSARRRHRKLITQLRSHRLTQFKIPLDFRMDALSFSDPKVRNPRPTNLQHRRHKRDHGVNGRKQHLYVEYVVVTDYQNYKSWHEQTGGYNLTVVQRDILTKYRMLQFYRHVVHGIDTIYQTLNGETKEIEIILTGVIFANVSGYATWTENSKTCPLCDTVDDQKALYDFAVWRRDTLSRVLKHDHAALFTGYDMYFVAMESPRTVGLSYLGSMCLNGSVSVVEEKRNAITTHIAAHELGHNFGAYHDGLETTSACAVQDRFLMVPSMSGFDEPAKASNPWTFSPCSKSDIYNNLDYLDQTSKNCLINQPSIPKIIPRTKAGIVYSADLQCQMQFGEQSSVCRDYHKNDWSAMCYSMACSVPDSEDCVLIFPHPGTPCGHKKWCHRGHCEEHDDAPMKDDLCPLGDDPHYNCVLSSCQDKDSDYSMDDIRRGLCCHTCVNITTTTEKPPNATTSSIQNRTSNNTYIISNVTMTTTAEPVNVTTSSIQTQKSNHTTISSNVTMTTTAEPVNVTTSSIRSQTSNHTTISSNAAMTTIVEPANITTSSVQSWRNNDTTSTFANITRPSSSSATVTKPTVTSSYNPTNDRTFETSTVKSSIQENQNTTTQDISNPFSSTDTSVISSSTVTSQPTTLSTTSTSLLNNTTNKGHWSVNVTLSSLPSSESPPSNSTNMATISTHNTSSGTTKSYQTKPDQEQRNVTNASSPMMTSATSTSNVLNDMVSTHKVISISTVERTSKLPYTIATDDQNNVLNSANFISISNTPMAVVLTTMYVVKIYIF